MKLYQTTINDPYRRPGGLLSFGPAAAISEFINMVGDGWGVYQWTPEQASDLDMFTPEGWTADAQWCWSSPTEKRGGYKTQEDALRALVDADVTLTLTY